MTTNTDTATRIRQLENAEELTLDDIHELARLHAERNAAPKPIYRPVGGIHRPGRFDY